MVQSAINERMTAKAFLRRLIVTTSVPPVVGVYRAIYRLLIRAAVWRLKQTASVRAIYLRRGLAAGEGVPGISDIDLAAVGDWDAAAQARLTESYELFARWCPLYDRTVGVYTPASIAELFEADPFHRHRLAEGQREWKLLFGADCLSHLEPVPDEDASFGYEAEMKLWWSYFARWAFLPDQSADQIFLNSLCYKVATECFRMDCGLRRQPVPRSRKDAMEEAVAGASGEAAGFLGRLQDSAKCRHLRYAGNVVEDSQSYVLALLEQSYSRLQFHPGWRGSPSVRLRIDAPEEERLHPHKLPESAMFRVASVSGGAFAMDELVLLFEPVSGTLPQVSDLQEVARTCANALSGGRSRVSLYLRLPNACYQFYASDYFRGWQAILSPRFNPDIFLDAGSTWTRPAAEFIRRERQLLVQALDDPVVYKANNLDFLRTFWKFLELAVIEATAQRDEIVFAQTPEAVVRGLAQLNLPRAPFLEDFALAYRDELRGAQSAIGRHIPAAIQFLKNINHEL
jgi:predicted nucleotidyltransferase